jgi:hypothetical protein
VQWWDSAGKRRELAFRTNREAKDFKIKLEHDQREGTFVDPRLGRQPFGDAARRWLAGLAVAPETRRAYQSVLDNRVLPAFGDRALQQVAQDRERTAQLLNQFWRNCPVSGGRSRGWLSPARWTRPSGPPGSRVIAWMESG